MPKANRIVVVLGLAAALLFAGGLNHLFRLRFEAGDVYPPYSSLRTDPLGTRALYESLARMPNLVVTRHFANPDRLPPPEGTTLILAGLERHRSAGGDRGIQVLKRFVVSGGRAVLMFKAVRPQSTAHGDDACEPRGRECDPPDEQDTAAEATVPTRQDGLVAWGVAFETPELAPATREAQRDPSTSGELPETIAWNSGAVLVAQHPDWQVRYRLDGQPVIMERRLGNGSIVVGTDSYLLSNEALRNHRQAGLLSWMVGAGRRVVFDETHLGIQHRPGVSSLIRRYRLHGLIAGLVLWAFLYIWRNNRPFPPLPRGARARDSFRLACQDADSALVSLIGRHLPDERLLATCVREHEKSLGRPGADTQERLERIKRLASEAGADPVTTYQTICRILARRPSQ